MTVFRMLLFRQRYAVQRAKLTENPLFLQIMDTKKRIRQTSSNRSVFWFGMLILAAGLIIVSPVLVSWLRSAKFLQHSRQTFFLDAYSPGSQEEFDAISRYLGEFVSSVASGEGDFQSVKALVAGRHRNVSAEHGRLSIEGLKAGLFLEGIFPGVRPDPRVVAYAASNADGAVLVVNLSMLAETAREIRRQFGNQAARVFEAYLLLLTGHEMDHMIGGKARLGHQSDLSFNVTEEARTWALTCEDLMRPIVKNYAVPLFGKQKFFYDAWLKSGRNPASPYWTQAISEVYRN